VVSIGNAECIFASSAPHRREFTPNGQRCHRMFLAKNRWSSGDVFGVQARHLGLRRGVFPGNVGIRKAEVRIAQGGGHHRGSPRSLLHCRQGRTRGWGCLRCAQVWLGFCNQVTGQF
jgi:hypothetical protein